MKQKATALKAKPLQAYLLYKRCFIICRTHILAFLHNVFLKNLKDKDLCLFVILIAEVQYNPRLRYQRDMMK